MVSVAPLKWNTIKSYGTKAVDTTLRKPLKAVSETKFFDYISKKYNASSAAEKAKFMSLVSVSSIVLKDGLGCYLYVKQSLNNDKIPADKRKFVAALDLANGGLMIAMQLLMLVTFSNDKVQKKLFNKMFGKRFERSAAKSLQSILEKKEKLKGMEGPEFHKALDNYKKNITTAFGYLTSLVAATILGKRVIVPFIATPLADKTKAWMSRNDKPAQVHKDTKNTYDTEEKDIIKNKEENEEATTSNLIEKAKINK